VVRFRGQLAEVMFLGETASGWPEAGFFPCGEHRGNTPYVIRIWLQTAITPSRLFIPGKSLSAARCIPGVMRRACIIWSVS